eukprot:gene5780-9601_t
MSKVCTFYNSSSGCKNGEECKFQHIKTTEQKIQSVSFSSSIVSMPPPEFWKQFVDIKKNHMNPKIKRPPFPHVTLIQPFLPYNEFSKAAKILTEKLSNFKSFTVEISTFEIFKNKSSSTLYLNPIAEPKDAYEELFSIVKNVFGDCLKDNFSFNAHIGVGYFNDHNKAKDLQKKYQKDWRPMKFQTHHLKSEK